jgi:hypothetical protein
MLHGSLKSSEVLPEGAVGPRIAGLSYKAFQTPSLRGLMLEIEGIGRGITHSWIALAFPEVAISHETR